MKTLSIWWGNQQSSPITKAAYRAAFKNYQAHFGDILVTEQMHGIAGQIIDQVQAERWAKAAPEGDYLITKEPNLWLGVLTADCLPIVFFDKTKDVIAIAHAGWRGTVAGIAQIVLTKLITNFQVDPQNLQIFFGPAARSCCYEVGEQFVANLAHDQIAQACVQRRSASYFFDVLHYNMLCLQVRGVMAINFNLDSNVCTICNPGYCSYRKERDATGLQLSLVALR